MYGSKSLTKSEELGEDAPDADDVADTAGEDEEVEEGVDVGAIMREGIDYGSSDIEHSLGDEPVDGDEVHALQQGLEGDEHREAHDDEAGRLHIAVLLQPAETDDGARECGSPHKDEQAPAPPAGIAHGDKGYG